MANDYNASINLNTADATKGVKDLDQAVSELDKKLLALDKTIKASQGNLDTVTKSMSELTRANAALIRSENDRAKATVQAARADRERIINDGKLTKTATDRAIAEAKAAKIRSSTRNADSAASGTERRRNAESEVRVTNAAALGTQRLATETVRTATALENHGAAATRAGMATERAGHQTARFAAQQERARNSSLALNDSLSNSRYLLYDVGQTYAVLSAALLAIPTATAAVAIAYEKDFAQVMRTNMDLAESGGSFASLRQELKDLATEIPLTFSQFSEISSIGGQLGIAGRDMGAFTETVAKFGAASNVSIEEASTAFGRFRQSFKDGSTEDYFNKLGSAIALVGVKSIASEKEIVAVSNQIMAAGSQFGFATKDIVGLSGALASVRIRPEMARGAFQRIMLGLSSAADEGAEAFGTFAKYTGLATDEAMALMKSDPSAFFYKYIGGIKAAIQETGSVSAVMEDIGAKNVFDKQFILGLANGYSTFGQALSDANKGWEEGSFLTTSTEGVFNTVDAKIQRLTNSLKNLADTVGRGTLEGLGGIVDNLMNIAGAAERFVQANKGIAGFLGLIMGLGGAIGILLAFKTAQAFVLAGLVGFQQVLGKTSIAAGLTLKGNMQELAKTMLMAKGVTAEASAEFIRNAGAMKAMGASATLTTVQIRALNAGLGTAGISGSAATATTKTTILTGAVQGLRGALALVGGPIGVIVTALGILGTNFMMAEEKANSAGDAIARAMANGEGASKRAIGDALTGTTVDSYNPFGGTAAGLGDHGKNVQAIAKEIGVSFEDIVNSIAKGEKAAESFDVVLNQLAQNKGYKDWAEMSANAFDDNAAKAKWLEGVVERLGTKSAKSAADQKQVADAAGDVGSAAAEAVPDVEGIGDAIGDVGDEAETAEEKIDKFISTVFGLADAQMATQSALGSLGEGLAESVDFGVGTEGGRNNIENFRDTLRAAIMEQQYLIDSTGKTTQQASADYMAFVDGLVKEMASRGVDPAAVMATANEAKMFFQYQLDATPDAKVGVQADTSKVLGTATALPQTLQQYINAQGVPSIGVDAETTPAQSKILGLANSLAAITGLPYQTVVDALTNPAHEKANEVYKVLTSITNGTYTAPVNADTTAAIANVQNFLAFARTELAHLQAELNGGVGYADGEGSMSPELKAQYSNLGAPMQVSTPAASAPAQVAAAPATAPIIPVQPNFDGLANGYDKVKDAAEDAGKKGKEAAEDMADGISDADRAASDFANRLRTGLQSAFEKQNGYSAAVDAYQAKLNDIKKKREDEKKQIQELITKQKELTAAANVDKAGARKAGIEKNISLKYGEADRAADYGAQEQELLESAAAKDKDAAAAKRQAAEIQAGIGKMNGFSQAAIENRNDLRDLESKMLDVISAYANTGASADQVRAKAASLTGQFKRDVTQIGLNKQAVQGLEGRMRVYRDVVRTVPAVKPTKVSADTGAARGAIDGIKNALGSIPRNTTYTVTQKKVTEQIYKGGVFHTESRMKDGSPIYRVVNPDGTSSGRYLFNKGGQVPGFASGGQIPGRAPSNPGVDNLMAQVDGKGLIRVRSKEFIVQQPAVDYWGLDFMNAINNMKMPQFNSGGSVGGRAGGSGPNGAMLVELTAEAIAAIQRMPPIILTTENRVIAQAANDGNVILATQGAS